MIVGIRREDKNEWEARVPLIPSDVEKLTSKGIRVILQPSNIRIFSDQEFLAVGAEIAEDLSECSLILAVKEIPVEFIENGKTYLFFSHTIKGQEENMPLLQAMIDRKTQLIDYERIIDNNGQRLIFFGRHAGLAGMINTFWAFGKRLDYEGITNPFSKIKKTFEYRGLENAAAYLQEIADIIKKNGLPQTINPIVCGFTGYGNVSQGAQEIFDIFPYEEISPEQLLNKTDLPGNTLYKVVFKESDMVEAIDPNKKFDLQDYYDNPQKYKAKFEQYLPKLSILVNCIYWDLPYPRLVALDYLKNAYRKSVDQKLRVIGDVSCDINGAIQCTVKSTDSGNPVFVYNPFDGSIREGVAGTGPVIMAVDNLPCELAEEASKAFSNVLINFIPQLAGADYNLDFKKLKLPPELLGGMILYQGQLTAEYTYLNQYL